MSRTAIITGASRGIGAAVAERLSKDGFSVVVNYAGSEAEASALVNKITSAGGRAITAKADSQRTEHAARQSCCNPSGLSLVVRFQSTAGSSATTAGWEVQVTDRLALRFSAAKSC